MTKFETRTSESLHEEFTRYAEDLSRGGNPRHLYYKSNSMRLIWHELLKRGEDPRWPDDGPVIVSNEMTA